MHKIKRRLAGLSTCARLDSLLVAAGMDVLNCTDVAHSLSRSYCVRLQSSSRTGGLSRTLYLAIDPYRIHCQARSPTRTSHVPPPPPGRHYVLWLTRAGASTAQDLPDPDREGRALQVLEGALPGGAWPTELTITTEPGRPGLAPAGPAVVRWTAAADGLTGPPH